MKILVVFYSLDGNTRFIAENIAKVTGADLLELKPVKAISGKSFMKYFWGGRQVVLKQKPELLPLEKDPKDYDLLFIGSPVWAYTFTPPLRTFFSKYNIKEKKIALFCCHGGDPKNTLINMAEALTGNEIIGKIDFLEPLKHLTDNSAEKVKNWAKDLVKM